MRADRLISILMLLQARGRMTAEKLAEELEVSVRTIYRDLDALSAAGIPVYAERGPGGGCALIEDYRTTLTGLTQNEVRALFMLSIPTPLAQLGVGQELKAALLKLSAALPDGRRHEQELVRQRIHLDSVDWFDSGESVPHLDTIRQAVWQDRMLYLSYLLPFETETERLVAPYGLVAKANTWYLVCARDDHVRVQRVAEVVAARLSEETFQRPVLFDLPAFWKRWCTRVENNQPHYRVVVRVAPDLRRFLPRLLGARIQPFLEQAAPPDASGWSTLSLPFESLEEARTRLLGLGRAVEILEPRALRESVLDFATQVASLYAP